jgi:hypothetical protein
MRRTIELARRKQKRQQLVGAHGTARNVIRNNYALGVKRDPHS